MTRYRPCVAPLPSGGDAHPQALRTPNPVPGAVVRVALYANCASAGEYQGIAIEAQISELSAYVASHPGWQVVATFSDIGAGAAPGRPGLQRALAQARAAGYDVFLVHRLDRLSRRARERTAVLGELEHVGVAFRSATEPFDTSSPDGGLLLRVLGTCGEFHDSPTRRHCAG